MKIETNNLILEQTQHLNKLQKIVADTIIAEELIINNLLHPQEEILTKGQLISDKVAKFGGSWKFIILFGIVLFVWIVFNVLALNKLQFDPYPFILMNLILSCIAALQAPIIMMSQNRKEDKDRKRSENDYLINLKAELEIRSMHQKIDLLITEELKTLFEIQSNQYEILDDINSKLNNHLNKEKIIN